uniref:Nedd2-like caspase n=1 Tax=Lymantria dispar TaxID=13123 RepID=H3JZW6_LYMDI|nr:Nedd2-like caspase [Lymantria dispar]
MEQEHRRVIQNNFSSLVERTDLDSVVTSLYEKGVFSEHMTEPYRDTNEPVRDRKRKLYRDITKRGPRAFAHLVDTLSELGYWDLVRDLDPNNPFVSMPRLPNSSNPIPPKRELNQRTNDSFVSISDQKTKTKNELKKKIFPTPPDLDNAASSITEIPEFNVIKSTKFIEEDDNNDLKLYRTHGRHRGVLVVFSYVCFENNIDTFRTGADIDCAMLKKLFSGIGFREISYSNLSYEQTVDTLTVLRDVLVDVESVFIVVSSHGYERRGTADMDIRCSDGKLITFYKIMSYFNNNTMPKLIGIPKVFIFQTCRGSSVEYAWVGTAASPQPMPGGTVQMDGTPEAPGTTVATRYAYHKPVEVPLYSDILIAHSTTPGCVSFRDKAHGSWYIQVLCEVFAKYAHNTHVDQLFTLVDIAMRDRFRIQTSSVDRWGFNKRLYLHPGLFE